MSEETQRLSDYRRLVEIARDLASTLDLDILLTRIVHAAADLTDAAAASILLYDENARRLYFQVATNLDEPTMRGLVVPMDSIAGWVVTNRKAVRVANVHQDPRYCRMVEDATHFPTESLMGAPLIAKDKVIGALEVLNKRSGEFSEADEDLLTVLCAQAAVAIENARLFQQSDLIAEFVHELRTPLSSINMAAYLLLRPEISQEQREQLTRNIYDETQRLHTLASSFLDLARLESGRVQFHVTRFELPSLLEECCQSMQTLAQANDIRVTLSIPADFPPVEADRDKFKQVVLNLLSNAIKYNRPGGSVTLSAGLDESYWTLQVEDTGIGIPAEALPRLFQKFYRVRSSEQRASGTGLGLSICQKIVSGHGGRIEVRSQPGQGTTFTIYMPRKAKGDKVATAVSLAHRLPSPS